MTPKNTITDKGLRTRQRILDSAADLFHQQGINATTVGDVLRASGAGKGQFYQHFESRDHLIAEVISSHRDLLAAADPIASWDDLEAWLRDHLETQTSFDFERGCPVGTAAYALQADQDVPRAILAEIFDRMRQQIAEFLADERRNGRLTRAADPQALANLTVGAIQGATLLNLVDRTPEAAEATIAEVLAHLRAA